MSSSESAEQPNVRRHMSSSASAPASQLQKLQGPVLQQASSSLHLLYNSSQAGIVPSQNLHLPPGGASGIVATQDTVVRPQDAGGSMEKPVHGTQGRRSSDHVAAVQLPKQELGSSTCLEEHVHIRLDAQQGVSSDAARPGSDRPLVPPTPLAWQQSECPPAQQSAALLSSATTKLQAFVPQHAMLSDVPALNFNPAMPLPKSLPPGTSAAPSAPFHTSTALISAFHGSRSFVLPHAEPSVHASVQQVSYAFSSDFSQAAPKSHQQLQHSSQASNSQQPPAFVAGPCLLSEPRHSPTPVPNPQVMPSLYDVPRPNLDWGPPLLPGRPFAWPNAPSVPPPRPPPHPPPGAVRRQSQVQPLRPPPQPQPNSVRFLPQMMSFRPNPSVPPPRPPSNPPPGDVQHQPQLESAQLTNTPRDTAWHQGSSPRLSSKLLAHSFHEPLKISIARPSTFAFQHSSVVGLPAPSPSDASHQEISTTVWPHEVSAASQTVQEIVGGPFVQAVLDADVQSAMPK